MLELDPKRILIVLLGAIGDVIRALPVLGRLRQSYPEAYIAWAVEPVVTPLLVNHPALNEVIVYQRNRGLLAFFPFLWAVRQRRFDLVLDLQRHFKSGLVSFCSRAPVRLGFHRRNAKEVNWLFSTHRLAPIEEFTSKLAQYLEFADTLGVTNGEVGFGLRLSAEEEKRVDHLLTHTPHSFAAFFLGSRWESRFWFTDYTAEVACRLVEEFALGVVLLGGPGEKKFAEEVTRQARVPVTNLTGQTGLRELIGIFQRARIAMGPDSGPMHVAAAVGVPVVSLWGATSPARSAPWGSEKLVIVGQAACSPCYVRRCPINRLCMRRITPEAVMTKISQVIHLRERA